MKRIIRYILFTVLLAGCVSSRDTPTNQPEPSKVSEPVAKDTSSGIGTIPPKEFNRYLIDAAHCLEVRSSATSVSKVFFMFHISAEGAVDSADVFYPEEVHLPDSCRQKLLEMPKWNNVEKKPMKVSIPVNINLR